MKLFQINRINGNKLLNEGYGRVFNFDYNKFNVDPRPKVLSLGRWTNHLHNKLLCGLNLHYLDDEQVERLRSHLQSILKDRNLKRRVNYIRRYLPDIFENAYRTYRVDSVDIVSPETLKFARTPEPDEAGTLTEPAIEPKKKFVKPPSISDKVKDRIDRQRGKLKPSEVEPSEVEPSEVEPSESDKVKPDKVKKLSKKDKTKDKSSADEADEADIGEVNDVDDADEIDEVNNEE